MDYSQFLKMIPEATLMFILVIAFVADFCSTGKDRKWFNPLMCVLMLAQILINILPQSPVSAFGGMYQTTTASGIIKTILALGTLIVLIQSRQWLSREDTRKREGEFYMLVISTLLGMNIMVSS